MRRGRGKFVSLESDRPAAASPARALRLAATFHELFVVSAYRAEMRAQTSAVTQTAGPADQRIESFPLPSKPHDLHAVGPVVAEVLELSPEMERALVQRAQNADEDAFGTLVRSNYEHVFRLVLSIIRDEHAARDVCQEVWVTV